MLAPSSPTWHAPLLTSPSGTLEPREYSHTAANIPSGLMSIQSCVVQGCRVWQELRWQVGCNRPSLCRQPHFHLHYSPQAQSWTVYHQARDVSESYCRPCPVTYILLSIALHSGRRDE